jgi:quercetin dioxygenase-like cupin family protein
VPTPAFSSCLRILSSKPLPCREHHNRGFVRRSNKAGCVFVTRVKFSPGWKDQPHWHPDEVRTVAVLSGTFYFGSGDTWDESKFKAYPAGTFYSEPPKAPHFTWAKDGEVIIQITGVGPSGKTFIPQSK